MAARRLVRGPGPTDPAYQVRVEASGAWQLRLFHVPAGPAFAGLRAALRAAAPPGARRRGAGARLTVLRLWGEEPASYRHVLALLAAHGILPARGAGCSQASTK